MGIGARLALGSYLCSTELLCGHAGIALFGLPDRRAVALLGGSAEGRSPKELLC